MASDLDTEPARGRATTDRDVAVVGGGPAGCSAAIFTARYGLDTVVFDRGRSSLRQCAHLENYPGFPGGVDVETFRDLLHDHVRAAGGTVRPDLVEAVRRGEANGELVVEPEGGEPEIADRVVAATRYGAGYLRPLDDGTLFEPAGGADERDRLDRSVVDRDGATPLEGVSVASPSAEADRQAIVAAGRGGRVGLAVVEAVRRDRGYPDDVAAHYDWLRREADRDPEWADRERWRAWFAERLPDDHDLSEADRRALRERVVDRRLGAYLDEAEIAERERAGQRRLLAHLDDDLVLERAREIEAEREAGGSG